MNKQSRYTDFFTLGWKGLTDWWLYLFTLLMVILGYVMGSFIVSLVQLRAMSTDVEIGQDAMSEFAKTMDWSLFNIDKNVGLILMISLFIFATIALILGLRLHKKTLKDIITPKATVDFKKILFSLGFWVGLTMLFEIIMYFMHPATYSFHFSFTQFLPLLFICLILLPIQTSFEEFLFRGYLFQAIGIATKSKWIPLILTSILFSLVHSANPEIEKFGFYTMQFYYVGAALLLGIITIMDDSLELALGVHAATNIFGALIVSYSGSVLQTDTLVKTSEMNPWLMIIAFYLSAAIFIFVCSKKYNWSSFRTIFEPIIKPKLTPISILPEEKPLVNISSENIDFNTDSKDTNTDYTSLFNNDDEAE